MNSSAPSGVVGMLAPSVTTLTPEEIKLAASLPFISFCVALGKAQSAGMLQSGFESPAATGTNSEPGNCSAYWRILPRRTFFSSMTQSSFSRSIPSGSWTNPPESDSVTGRAPTSISFSAVNWATFPLPETRHVLPSRLSLRVANISCAK